MTGKAALLAGAAAVALALGGGTAYAAHAAPQSRTPLEPVKVDRIRLAQTDTPDSETGSMTLEERVRRLEEKSQTDHTRLSTIEQNANDTSWSFDNARPTVKSGDGRFTMAIRVRFQADEVNFFQKSSVNTVTPTRNVQFKDLSSGSAVRRAYFGVEGKAFKDFWYEFRYNAGGSGDSGNGVTEGDPALSLARIAYLGIPNFRLNLGVIEPTFMYEGTTSSGQLPFMERPEIDNIAADSFGAGDARRGVELVYQKESAFMPGDNLVLGGAFTGNKTGSASSHGNGGDEATNLLAHGSYRVWSDGTSNVSFGGDYSHAFTGGGSGGGALRLRDRPEFRVDGDRLIDTGSLAAKNGSVWAVSGGANLENFYLGGEYARFNVDRKASGARVADTPHFSGWYVEGSWVLTGEPKSYTVSATNNEAGGFGAPKVAKPFSFDGDSWGAWELTARFSKTDLNWHEDLVATATAQAGIAGGREQVLMVGLNWYLNNNIKLQVNDAIVQVDKLATAGSSVAVGQNLNILGVRLQFTN